MLSALQLDGIMLEGMVQQWLLRLGEIFAREPSFNEGAFHCRYQYNREYECSQRKSYGSLQRLALTIEDQRR